MSFHYPKITLFDACRKWSIPLDGSYIHQWLRTDIVNILSELGYPSEEPGPARFEMDYLAHSGDKLISKNVFQNFVIEGNNGFIPLSDEYDYAGNMEDSFFERAVEQFNARCADNIKKIFDAYTTQYKPLDNYAMVEDMDYTPKAQQTVKSSNKSKTDTTTDVGVYGFNSTVAVPSSTTDSGTTQLKNDNEMETTTSYDGEKDNTHTERSGNIGVTTSQRMLEAEIQVRKLEILELIFQGLDEVICQSVYD